MTIGPQADMFLMMNWVPTINSFTWASNSMFNQDQACD